jgi:hypothetical protein
MYLFFFLLIINELSAQTVTTPEINKKLIPPSPDAASLGKYGILPVTLYSGQANVSVPIAELRSGNLSVPISLSYNNNGYRPGEESSWIGLGWTLQGTGVITRIVKGRLDESTDYTEHWQNYGNVLDMTLNMDFMELVGRGDGDSEPDLYIFNFNGHAGKFVLVGNRAVTFPHQDLKITLESTGFRIIDENGINYFFQDTETTNPRNKSNGSPFMPSYTSAWYLTKIASADNLDQINFSYTSWTHSQANLSYSETYQAKSGITSGHTGCGGSNSGCDSWSTSTLPGASLTVKRLTRISAKDGYIDFIPEATSRKDFSSTSAYALKDIIIYSKPDSLLRKKIGLVHGYFGNITYSTQCQLKLSSLTYAGYYVNKTIGNTITADSIVIPNYYAFEYNNENDVVTKGTRAIDKWGYYNGKDNNASLFDANFLGYTPLMTPGDRTVDASKSINGVLSKITYPTGGYTTFDYEANRIGGGAQTSQEEQTFQVSKTSTYDGTNNPTGASQSFTINMPQVINIMFGRDISTYLPNGIINNNNILKIYLSHSDTAMAELVYTSKKLGKPIESATDTLTLQTLGTYFFVVYCESQSANSFATITYKKLVPIANNVSGDPGPGLRVTTISSFDNINSGTPALVKKYSYAGGTLLSSNIYGYSSVQHKNEWGFWTETIFTSDYSSPLYTLVSDQFYYTTVSETNRDTTGSGKTVYEYGADGVDALGVFLINQSDYAFNNNNFVLLKQKINTYDTKPVMNLWGFTSNLSQIVDDPSCGCNIGILPLESDIYDTTFRFKLYEAHPYYLSSEYLITTATDEISYDQNGANPMTIHTNYYFDNPNILQPTRMVTLNSKGDSIITQTKYALDYDLASCGSLYSFDTTFVSARANASVTFQANVQSRKNAAYPYYSPGTPAADNSALKAALRNYSPNCENTYKTSYATAVSNMNSSIGEYYSCLSTAGTSGSFTDAQKAVILLQAYHDRNTAVEQIVSLKKGSSEYLFAATKTDFTNSGSARITPKFAYETGYSSTSTLKSSFVSNPSNYYKQKVNFTYDQYGNIIEQSKTDDVKTSYVWDNQLNNPVAQVSGASVTNIAYTSFETVNGGNWTIGSASRVNSGITGSKSYNLSNGSITKGSLNSGTTYIISYWLYSGSASVSNASSTVSKITKNGWTCYEATVSGYTSYTISGSGNIDELRLYPQGTLMTTYTYDPLIGLTSAGNPNYIPSYCDYDPLGRLRAVRDGDRNILKLYDYRYQTLFTTYFNTQQSGTYTRNNCSSGQTGSNVTYTVPAGTYSSQISQADANQKATNDVTANGQAYANTNGTCSSTVTITSTNFLGVSGFVAVFTNTSTSQQYSFNVSSAGGSQALGSIPAGTYNVTISKSGNSTVRGFGVGGYWQYGTSATFSNVSFSSTTNNTVIVDTVE